MPLITLTCRTEGCPNDGIPIDFEYDEDVPPTSAVCGACNQPITEGALA